MDLREHLGRGSKPSSASPEIWPNFFIVGAAKCGTTSLYAYLKQHPQVYMSPMKEPHFFSPVAERNGPQRFVDVVTDRDAYLALFEGAAGYPAVGEASTSYLGFEETADVIREQVPDARIIILLRDPIERAYSHYLMAVRNGLQNLPFHEVILREREDPRVGWGPAWHRYTMLYYPGVKRYLDAFGGERVLVLLTEDLKRDPRGVTRQAVEFLGLDPAPVEDLDLVEEHNPYRAPRNRLAQSVMASDAVRFVAKEVLRVPKPMLWFLREQVLFRRREKPVLEAHSLGVLREIHEGDIAKLEDLLGRPLPELRRSWKAEVA
jgi:hypothetical protein